MLAHSTLPVLSSQAKTILSSLALQTLHYRPHQHTSGLRSISGTVLCTSKHASLYTALSYPDVIDVACETHSSNNQHPRVNHICMASPTAHFSHDTDNKDQLKVQIYSLHLCFHDRCSFITCYFSYGKFII